jgi:hypothetical protein
MGSTPIPGCSPVGTKLFFDDAVMAITGKTDDLGRDEILVKTAVHLQVPNESPGISDNHVSFGSADSPYQYYGGTAPRNGCVFAKIYAPTGAVGKIVRLGTSVFICAPDRPEAAVPQDGMAVAALSLGWTSLQAFLDVPIPAKTAETSLDDCGVPSETFNPWRDSVLRPKLYR